MARTRRTADQMYPLVESYLASGRIQKDFAAQHGLSAGVLGYWLSKYRERPAERRGGFVEITPPQPSVDQPVAEVVFPSGVRLRFFSPLPADYLRQLAAPEAMRA